ncbi:MAG: tetratricopeptide repeat protein, partial [Planctomycetes bacterium]|nr:tetratricopeptide repeat protein [Planctomycetota bacterium]
MRTLPTTRPPLISIICALVLCVAPARGQDTIDDSTALRGYFTGNGLLNREMYELAVPEYRRFLDDHADHEKAPVARYGLAVSLFRLARYDEAVVELKQLRPRAGFAYAAEVLTILGQCQLARGQFDMAAECFGDVLREHPGHDLADDAAALAAESLYRAGRFE